MELLIYLILTFKSSAHAELLISPQKALQMKFGRNAKIEIKNIALTSDQLEKVVQLSKSQTEDKIYQFFVIRDASNKILSYAGITTDLIRTHNQTILYFINPQGILSGAELIAYYEPPEYQVKGAYFVKNLNNKSLKSPLKAGKDLPVVSGSTLTLDSLARSTRRILAVWKIGIENTAANQ